MEKATELVVPRASLSKREGGPTPSATPTLRGNETDEPAEVSPKAWEAENAGNQMMDSTPDEPKEGTENTEYVTGYKLVLLLCSLTTFFFLLMLDISIISTAVPQITSDFHSLQDIGWYTGAYQLTSATLQPLTGKVYTRVKAKWVFLFFFMIFELGSLLCAVSVSSAMFVVGRAVAGIGSSGLQNGSLTIIAGAVPLEKRPMYMGFTMAFGQIGIVIAPLIGGLFTQYVTWRWCFYINLPLGGLAAVFLTFLNVPDQTVKPQVSFALLRKIIPDLDLIGFAIFAPASVMFLMALQFGSYEYPWDSATVIGLFVGAGVAFIIFLFWEHREGDAAMIPFSMVKRRIVWVSSLQCSCLMITVFVLAQFAPIYFQSVKGVGPSLSGVYMLPNILSSLFFTVLSGVLVTRLGYYLPWAAVAGAGVSVGAGLISTWDVDTPSAFWIGSQVLYGVRGCGIQAAVVALQNSLAPAQSALGIAFLIFCQNFSSAVFAVVANTIFTQMLLKQITTLAPTVNADAAVAAGGSATAVRALVPPGSPELFNVLRAYSNSFDTVCYLLIASGGLSFVASWGMGWVDVRKKKEPGKGEP
ncbi:putative MFS multidrug transporter [Hypoxylon sp. FL1284]|nr:putative MFS multidrug transporter [Hypoxylon sp. FL1284]